MVPAYERLLRAAGDWRDAYVLAALRSGDTYDWLDSSWFSERVLAPLREKALTAPLVEMARGGRSAIVGSQLEPLVRFPTGSSRDLQEALWEVAEPLAGDQLPIRDHVSVWRGQLWTDEFDLTPAHLVLMAARGNLSALVDTMGVGVNKKHSRGSVGLWHCSVRVATPVTSTPSKQPSGQRRSSRRHRGPTRAPSSPGRLPTSRCSRTSMGCSCHARGPDG